MTRISEQGESSDAQPVLRNRLKIATIVTAGILAVTSAEGHISNAEHEAIYGTSIHEPEITFNPLTWVDAPLHAMVDPLFDKSPAGE